MTNERDDDASDASERRTPRPEVYDTEDARRLANLASLFFALGNHCWESAGLLGKPGSTKYLAALARIAGELLELKDTIADTYIELSARRTLLLGEGIEK